MTGEEHSDRSTVKDAEIQRLIEERRSTPNEEKQRLKDLSKCIKNASEKKRMKRQRDIQRILENLRGVRNIPGNFVLCDVAYFFFAQSHTVDVSHFHVFLLNSLCSFLRVKPIFRGLLLC